MSDLAEKSWELAEEGFDLIAEGQLDEAEAIGDQLVAIPHEAGFQLLAAVAFNRQEMEIALGWLDKGLSRYPKAFRLLLQKGEYLSGWGKFEEAEAVFIKARNADDPDPHYVDVALAHNLFLQEKVDEALNLLKTIKHPEAVFEATVEKYFILDSTAQHDRVLADVTADLEALPEPSIEEDDAIMAQILAYVAKAAYLQDEPEATVRQYLRESLDYDRTCEMALWLLRELDPQFSDNSKLYFLDVTGKFADVVEEDEDSAEFATGYTIVADSIEEALEYVRAFEGDVVDPASLRVVDQEVQKNEEGLQKGIYETTGLFSPDEDEDE